MRKKLRCRFFPRERADRKPHPLSRLGFAITFTALLAAPAHLSGASQQVDLSSDRTELREVFRSLKEQTGYMIIYSDSRLAGERTRDAVEVKDVSLERALDLALAGLPYTYRIEDRRVIIIPDAGPDATQQAPARTVIRGRVTDSGGRPLGGATVEVEGTHIGTTTDASGAYTLSVARGEAINFSFMGMTSRRVVWRGEATVDIALEETTADAGAVVVTGIFERIKEGFTGSATAITGDEVRRLSSGNALRALAMLDPGFTIATSNMTGSNPNAIPDYQMRGSAGMGNYETDDVSVLRGDVSTRTNQPLFVLDGVIGVSPTAIMDLDPEQIESMTLLKDAAATVVYGSEAANGVVVVETRRPVAGKLRVTYNGKYGITWPDLGVYDLASAREKLDIEKLAGYPDEIGTDPTAALMYYNALEREVMRGVDTDWLAIPVHSVGTHRHGVDFEGGDQSLRYKIHMGANFAPGVMRNTDLDGQSGRIDIHYRFGKLQLINQTMLDYSEGRRESDYGSFAQYALMNPYYTPWDDNGNVKLTLDPPNNYNKAAYNPLYNTLYDMRNEFTELSIRETLRLEYRPIDPLRLDFDFTLSKTKGTTDVFRSSHHTDFATAGLPENKGSYTKGNSDDNSYRVSLTASYNKVFGGAHLVSLLGRYTVQQSDAYSQLLSMTGFPNDKLSEVFMGAKFGSVTGDESVSRSLGAVFTGSYSYRQRYAVDFSMRADAASQFGRDNRFAPFWSAGAKWSVHNEDFMQNAGAVDELILRASVGTTGSQDFNPWQALQTYTYEGMMTNYISSDVVGAVLYALGNPALKWQQTLEKNIGFDVTLFEGLFGAKVELYDRRTRNTLLDYTLPPSMGFTTVKENLGEISNRGYEITARFMPWRNNAQRAYWNVVLTGGHNRSRIEKISDAMKALNQAAYTADGADLTRPLPQYVEGVSQSAIWGMRSVGIDPQTGEEIFLTRGGEFTTEWSPNDVVVIGDRRPDLAGSVTSTVAWRDLSLTVGGSYTFGGQIYNQTLADKVENADLHRNVDRRVLTDRWHAPGDVVGFKNLDGSDTRDKTKATSRFVMRNDEFRLSSVNLSYRMSAQDYGFLKHAGLGSATVGLYLEDVMRLSTVRMERGINYPFARTVSMSLNLAF